MPVLFIFPGALSATALSNKPVQEAAILDERERQRHQIRERAQREKNSYDSDVRLAHPTTVLPDYPKEEHPCFTIHNLVLKGDSSERFQWALHAANDAKGRCLGGQGIVLVINKVQNAILARGYITTRVMAQEQDLTKGVLTLTLQPGRINDIRFDESVSWRGRIWNAIPASRGDILNLRDIEQGLENLTRAPSAAADIKIMPGARDATSDLQVSWKESRAVRLRLGLEDGNSKKTGVYLGSATLSVDAPLAHNDLFYISLSENQFQSGPSGKRSKTLNYVFPLGYWAFSAYYNRLTYKQVVSNINQVLNFSGKSDEWQLTASRLIFRNQSHRTTINVTVYRRNSTNAVNDYEMKLYCRRTAGWEMGVNQRSYPGGATLDGNLSWRSGTGMFGARPAPGEATHTGSARSGILLGDISLHQPFSIAKQPWRYYSVIRGQSSPKALTSQDRMDIAGRYTVRGFDGEHVLSGDRGLLWRNELAWNVRSRGHEVYLAMDYGYVGGPAARNLVGRQLAGGAIGLRGALPGQVNYDLFVGLPLYKPQNFTTSGVTAGFNLNLTI
ncbi:ShlB/FhaC/HecB family hemolysin secretion/activation protein [Martelella alba]|uniref:ShlB/FhaC/HecB family hemolysin secretion/activation protein n=2 Tax=Martelella alba TaxID=2590451 RepID=A0ABY2SHZ1_9HYPH|nr:ShlB/FhaC/HecB family hemolysin secretion/activation protein [Martelella alba]